VNPAIPAKVILEFRDVRGLAPSWKVTEAGVVAPGGKLFPASADRGAALRGAAMTLQEIIHRQPNFRFEKVRAETPPQDFWATIFNALARSESGERVEMAGGYLVLEIEALYFKFTWDDIVHEMQRGAACG